MSKEKEDPKVKPMDASIRESRTGTIHVNQQRPCYAAKTLVAEVTELFPETPFEYSNYDGRNTALDVSFDLTMLDHEDTASLIALLTLFDFGADPRINLVIEEDEVVLVSFRPSARTKDSRESFGLADAWDIFSSDAEVQSW